MRVFFRSRLSYSDHSVGVFFSERVELLRSLRVFFFLLEWVDFLRSLNEGIFQRGLSYSDHSMKVSKFAKCEVVEFSQNLK